MEKLCKRCGKTKFTTEFPKHRKTFDGLYTYCKTCSAEKTRSNMMKPPRRTPPPGLKWCSICKTDLPFENFYPAKQTYDQLSRVCKKCNYAKEERWRQKNKPKVAAIARRWRQNNPESARDHQIKSFYGLPRGTYDHLFQLQGGKCAICGTTEPGAGRKSFSIDHCHDTGICRGLLCGRCNTGIGYLAHDITVLEKSIAYLKNNPGIVPFRPEKPSLAKRRNKRTC